MVPLDQPNERTGLVHREVVLGATARARQVNVTGLLGAVVFGAAFEMRVRQHPHLLEQGQGSIDRRGVDARHFALDGSRELGGRDVSLRPHDLRDDRPALRRHAKASLAQELDHVGPGKGHVVEVSIKLQVQVDGCAHGGGRPRVRAAHGSAVRACRS
jgi:hypothetical protein